MGFDKKAFAAAKKYVKETMKGAGAVKGDKGDPGTTPITYTVVKEV